MLKVYLRRGIYHNNQPGFLPSACLRPCGLEIWSLVRKGKAVCKISGVFFPGKGERTKAEIYDVHFMPCKESIHLSICLSLSSFFLSTCIYIEIHMFQAVSKLIWRQIFLSCTALKIRLKMQYLIYGLLNLIFLFVFLFYIHCSVFSGVLHGISISNKSSDYLETEKCQSRRYFLKIQAAFCNNHAFLIYPATFWRIQHLCIF